VKRKKRLVKYFNEQAGHCVYCDDKMTLDLGQPKTAEIEHVIPKAMGGRNGHFNEVAACHECNQDKGSTHVSEWLRKRTGEKHKVDEQFILRLWA